MRDRGGGHWQARFRYKEGDKWRTLSRNLEATSKRDANKKATQLHRQLEEEAERAKLRVLLVMDEDEAVLERFLEKYISGIEGSGQIERTTAAGYRSSAAHICRYLGDVRIDDITADMIVSMQRRLLTEDGLCPDSVAYVEFVQVRCYESTRPRPRHSGGRKPPPPVPHAQAPLTLVGTGGYGSSEARFHACCVIVKLLSAAHTLVYSDEPGGCIRICNACTLTARDVISICREMSSIINKEPLRYNPLV